MKVLVAPFPTKKVIATKMTIWHTALMEAKELKQMRVSARMTIEHAAGYALVSPRTWARWESGKVNIPERGVKLFELMMSQWLYSQVEEGSNQSNHGKT